MRREKIVDKHDLSEAKYPVRPPAGIQLMEFVRAAVA